MPGLGRITPPDWEHLDRYNLASLLPAEETTVQRKDYFAPLVYNQGDTPKCVGYSSAGLMSTVEWIDFKGQDLVFDGSDIYTWANQHDGDTTPHDGTSVRAGMECLRQVGAHELVTSIQGEPASYRNKISKYYWSQSISDCTKWILTKSPVVFGTVWLDSMFNVDDKGFIVVDRNSSVAGGHAYLVNGIDTAKGWLRVTNSWGLKWGKSGQAFLSIADANWLLRQDGEVCAVVDVLEDN